ncbi:MAG: DUF4474 domain-containing protein [Peptococcaceae bacterium]|nr:DUF4474 domain-containing protein [Peptococcaceae bacterium]
MTLWGEDLWRPDPGRLFPEEIILNPNGNIPKEQSPYSGEDAKNISEGTESEIEETGIEQLDELAELTGYSYDPEQDIFISNIRPWQRYIGYCRLYDEFAAPTGMIIDCDEIYFEYQDKQWMIGLWKGQYDMVTGGEIGFYKNALKFNIPGIPNALFYNAVDDEDMLEMSYVLKKNGNVLFTRKAKHWWLTGFKPGEFSEPSELSMDISITLKDIFMTNAFLAGMKKAGYQTEELLIDGNTVSFTFDAPRTRQPWTRKKITDRIIQRKNKFLCDKYQELTGSHNTVQEKIRAIKEQDQEIYQKVRKMGKMSYTLEGWITVIAALFVLYYLGSSVQRENP